MSNVGVGVFVVKQPLLLMKTFVTLVTCHISSCLLPTSLSSLSKSLAKDKLTAELWNMSLNIWDNINTQPNKI